MKKSSKNLKIGCRQRQVFKNRKNNLATALKQLKKISIASPIQFGFVD